MNKNEFAESYEMRKSMFHPPPPQRGIYKCYKTRIDIANDFSLQIIFLSWIFHDLSLRAFRICAGEVAYTRNRDPSLQLFKTF